MRLLHVTRELLADQRYGLGRSLLPVVAELQQRGMAVRYLCQADVTAAALAKRNRWVHRLRSLPGVARHPNRQLMISAWAERLQMGWFAAQVARAEGVTHVHLHDPWMGLGFLLGKNRYRLGMVRWGVTEHGFGCYSRATHDDGLLQGVASQRILRRIEQLVLNHADWVTLPTPAAADALARDLALPLIPAHWYVVPHARPVVAPMDKALARKTLGWQQDWLVVLGVGRLVPLKRFDLLLNACLGLAQAFPQLHLQLLGGGDASALMAHAAVAGFADRLHIIETEAVAPYLRAADIYASTSETESFGLANLEALAAGLPALCTSVGGVPDVVGNGAWLIPGQAMVVQDSLAELLRSPELRYVIAQRGLARASSWPDIKNVTDSYVAIYQK